MTDTPRRRATDWMPDDHDLLITLSANLTNFMLRIEEQFKGFQQAHIDDVTSTTKEFTEIKTRLSALETWKSRVEGALFAGNKGLLLIFAAGSAVGALSVFFLARP